MVKSHGITVIRTNRDAADFGINRILNQIYKHITQSNKEALEKEKLEKEKEVKIKKLKNKLKQLHAQVKQIKMKKRKKKKLKN